MVSWAVIVRLVMLFLYFTLAGPLIGIFGFLLLVLSGDGSAIGYYFEEFLGSFAWLLLPSVIGGVVFVAIVALWTYIQKRSPSRLGLAVTGAMSLSIYFNLQILISLLDPPGWNRWLLLLLIVSTLVGAALGVTVPKMLLPVAKV